MSGRNEQLANGEEDGDEAFRRRGLQPDTCIRELFSGSTPISNYQTPHVQLTEGLTQISQCGGGFAGRHSLLARRTYLRDRVAAGVSSAIH
jgi:hypothetical protein